ncbi:STAS domain-containing protein [methanotrophic endosymbiont of Bathymodiolus puteoserpentis (Logatchev)]|jgi:anti-anti-sigma factor|uniref:STAS domain-containing protein n=1 Tax=methanotrophic endosymbiont of Bathymodiolus puteoserpentis (Logatchev) TaxID=343235 RepID=UPI0013CB4A85|nr:STAS domain-containing protein [methanotrophic endosymbiont of Bathymodiolus puteoserpentis (Logatchev)]SHE23482.1 Anti-sigma F factor antagonist (spoIIAA-2); Anti-sigma B factor antagonist RsbV [methanotrophic endosymbiont of Bathymodiolus puteoserpentis (Logatchev)]
MTVEVFLNKSNNELQVKVIGRFDFSLHQDFRKLSEQAAKGVSSISIDLGRTEYVDSSALGMLLVLRDKVSNQQSAIKIINACPDVKKILIIANFDKLFTVM